MALGGAPVTGVPIAGVNVNAARQFATWLLEGYGPAITLPELLAGLELRRQLWVARNPEMMMMMKK